MPRTIESKEYANLDGKLCPHCRSKHTVALSPVDVGDDALGYQHMAC